MFTMHNSGVKSSRHVPTVKTEKEAIHSGQFMVSHFVADEQDEEDELSVPVLEAHDADENKDAMVVVPKVPAYNAKKEKYAMVLARPQAVCIENSLSNLFKCMSLAYRQKLTSPKWNRFRGIRLRWKEKIRLNNVIWRCWHMQFIKRENTLICQFASPLDSDTHNKPEAVVLEGKYWKRKLAAVTAEYKKCRMFYRNKLPGPKEETSDVLTDLDLATWDSHSNDMHMLVDEDYMEFMTDTLFSTITNQPFQFPDSREIAKAGLADFIQPSLGPLQPNLDDFYMDTFDAYQEVFSGKLSTVPEQPEYFQEQGLIQSYASDSNLAILANNPSIHPPNLMASMHQLKQPQQQPQHYPMQLMDETFRLQAAPYQPQQSQVQQSNIQAQQQQQQSTGLHQQHLQQEGQQQKHHRKVERHRTTSLQSELYTKGYQNYDVAGSAEFGGSSNEQVPLNQMNYKQLNQINAQDVVSSSTGYKFAAPMAPNMKFTTQNSNNNHFKMPARQMSAPMLLNRNATNSEVTIQPEPQPTKTGRPRGRPRSRSNTREVVKKQPLLSASSDPSLVTQQSSSFLLAQLLTTNNEAYHQTQRNSNTNLRIKEESAPIAILPHALPASLVITSAVNNSQSHVSDPLSLNMSSNSSNSLDVTSQSLHSPTSSHSSSIGSPNREIHRDMRRAGHIHAEQKRRYNIKNGFDMMHSLIPQLNQNPNAKLSKAAMLQKGAEYIRQLRSERCQLKEEMDGLKQQIDSLNTSISNCQSLLPATGAPVSRRHDNKMQDMFEQYVRRRTLEDWKFWIFSLLFRPLLLSFNNFVSTSSLDDLYRTTIVWIEQHCTLVDLRPVVLNSLRYLCTKTDILADPDKLPGEAREAVLTPSTQSSKANIKQL